MVKLDVIIINGDKIYSAMVQDGATLEYSRKDAPGKFTFSLLKDNIIDFQEGNRVQVMYGDKTCFIGHIFSKKRNKDGIISVTAYDQLRYLKNKDVGNFENKKAGDVIKELAENYRLTIGEFDDTHYVIPKQRWSNECIIDVMQKFLDITKQYEKKIFVLYDDCGKLMLKNIENMKVEIIIDAETAENFNYESSIDKDTYNQIKLFYDDKDAGKRKVIVLPSEYNINRWGLLQYTESVNPKIPINLEEKARVLLGLYNQVRRSLNIQNAIGDIRVRGGSSVILNLKLGDVNVNNKWMLVENIKHKFANNEHLMDLTLKGDVINK